MFDSTIIKDKLYGIVGFNQPFNPAFAIVDAANLTSRSGYFVDDIDFVKIESLKDSQDFKDIDDSDFNLFLKRSQQESITNVANLVFNSPDYFDRNLLYRFASNKTTPQTLPDGFVGYRIRVSDNKNVAFEIKRVLLEFSGTPSFDLLLYNTAQAEPIETQSITITSAQQEVELNWKVNNSEDYYKGEYYLGYVTTSSINPFERNYNNANSRSVFTHLEIWPITVLGHTGTAIFDLDDQDGIEEYIGVNPDITVYEDFTDLIVNNETLFGRAVYLDLGIKVLSTISASIRSNRNERIGQDMLKRIIVSIEGQDGDGVIKMTGLRPQLRGVIKQLQDEVRKLKEGYFGGTIQVITQP